MSFTKLIGGVYDTMQLPDNSAHIVELNAPPTLPSLHDIVPVGVLGKLDVSVIFAENDIEDPGCTVARLGSPTKVPLELPRKFRLMDVVGRLINSRPNNEVKNPLSPPLIDFV